MPYIKSTDDRREKLRNGEPALNAGELNYQLFYYVKHNVKEEDLYTEQINIIIKYIRQFLGEKPNYQRYNDMTGAIIRCQKEIHRRLDMYIDDLIIILDSYDDEIAKYEDLKIQENGDCE